MKKNNLLVSLCLTAMTSLGAGTASAETVLNVSTAGSQNMVDYVKEYLAPKFEASHPGVKVRVVGSGPGDAGSNKIYEKLNAQQKSGANSYDIDVAVVHQKFGGKLVSDDLLSRFKDEINTGKLATRSTTKNALGANVDGYVMPMFHSQTAIAYNSDVIANPPASYDELIAFTKKHPKVFGYNGIKNGMSGVSFVTGWIYAYGTDAATLTSGSYDPKTKDGWDKALRALKAFNENVTFTPGNAGTLDMLNRGEIHMGPVWVDMFYSWQAQGKVPPSVKLQLIAPGMPGQPMYYVIPKRAENMKLARDFVELATSPEVQANGIVKRFNWYPGIDAQHVKSQMDQASWNKLFKEITPQDLSSKGQSFPLAAYFDDIKESYERKVSN
ncbi:extracellular solute-binding protein [Parendozoicomonas haliclonae]|uniref:Bacterial extracellular solute-binding protein n=1 Tax=Parendozoicomonas haliclonae TaxID=1960125 RepID=A0A1X7AGQ4_9GAMM|nr:extracellular solute-binding protein [Parendozoicomonas haliclonae]SMA39657.1 hypothetical protein EHSB41UT_01072 [Parendozoicomonas haliclonae]